MGYYLLDERLRHAFESITVPDEVMDREWIFWEVNRDRLAIYLCDRKCGQLGVVLATEEEIEEWFARKPGEPWPHPARVRILIDTAADAE